MRLYSAMVVFMVLSGIIYTVTINACGGEEAEYDFLPQRENTLRQLPDGLFRKEAIRFITKPDARLVPHETTLGWNYYYQYYRYYKHTEHDTFPEHLTEERSWVKKSLYTTIDSARSASTVVESAQRGASLPVGLRLYICGAIAYKNAKTKDTTSEGRPVYKDESVREALSLFDSTRRLPTGQSKDVALRATYMRGECFLQLGMADSAMNAFRQVRKLVVGGTSDPLGLGCASFGEEAKIEYRKKNIVKAVRLYAQQAACYDDTAALFFAGSGVSSLCFCAKKILGSDSLIRIAMTDTVCQKLLGAYLYHIASIFVYDNYIYDEADIFPPLQHAISEIRKYPLKSPDAGDLIAAAAYRAGKFAMAQKLVNGRNSPLAWWIKAKLAMHNGAIDSAAAAYSQAISQSVLAGDTGIRHAFFANWVSYWYRGLPLGPTLQECEYATLQVTRGDFMNAFKCFYQSDTYHGNNIGYLAERVLTVDELTSYIAEVAPGSDTTKWAPPVLSGRITREILARRMLRESRGREALPYFDDAETKKYATEYCDARENIDSGSSINRARNLYKCATLMNTNGWKLIRYYTYLYGDRYGERYALQPPISYEKGFATQDEMERLARTQPQPNREEHYHYVAVDYAMQAAALLPPRSQAFAAVLAYAYTCIKKYDRKMYQNIYQMYLKAHPAYSFELAGEPDFDGAEKMMEEQKAHREK